MKYVFGCVHLIYLKVNIYISRKISVNREISYFRDTSKRRDSSSGEQNWNQDFINFSLDINTGIKTSSNAVLI